MQMLTRRCEKSKKRRNNKIGWAVGYILAVVDKFCYLGRAVDSQTRAWYQNQDRAPCKSGKNNGPPKMMITSKSINNQKKVNVRLLLDR